MGFSMQPDLSERVISEHLVHSGLGNIKQQVR